jgi:hypothetical protein
MNIQVMQFFNYFFEFRRKLQKLLVDSADVPLVWAATEQRNTSEALENVFANQPAVKRQDFAILVTGLLQCTAIADYKAR